MSRRFKQFKSAEAAADFYSAIAEKRQQASQEAWEAPATVVLGRNRQTVTGRAVDRKDIEMRVRHLTPYTNGCKKTRTKMKSGGASPDSGSTTNIIKQAHAGNLSLGYQSAGYGKGRALRLRVKGNRVIAVDTQQQTSLDVCQFVERWDTDLCERVVCLEWLIDPVKHPIAFDRVSSFLGLLPEDDRSYDKLPAERRAFCEVKTIAQRDIERKFAKKAKSAARPPSRVRKQQALRDRQLKKGNINLPTERPSKTIKLY